MKKRTVNAVAVAAASVLALSACGSEGGSDSAQTELNYWLWDSSQLPAYQQCADDFHAENPETTVTVTQRGWDDYWSTLTNGFIAGDAPDIFTNHVTKYPDFLKNDQLLSLDDALEEDPIDLSIYTAGLADLWVGEDGKRYGLPKDWDTVAVFYNKTMTTDAGISEDQMNNLDWNPDDGGSYEEAIAHLTVDKNGTRGDERGFDKNKVAVYGLGLNGAGGGLGQAEWSYLTGTTGWTHTEKNPWANHFNYDDPKFQKTIDWYAGLTQKGYMARLETTVGASTPDVFGGGKSAINVNGSWTIAQYAGYDGIDIGLAPTPIGVNGERASMLNGLSDSVWAGTKNPEAASKFAIYLGSTACQDVVASKGVIFPAITTSSEKAAAAFEAKGIEVSAFTQHVEDGTTFLFPIANNASKVEGIMKPAMDAVVSGTAPASSLTEANKRVNALFK